MCYSWPYGGWEIRCAGAGSRDAATPKDRCQETPRGNRLMNCIGRGGEGRTDGGREKGSGWGVGRMMLGN